MRLCICCTVYTVLVLPLQLQQPIRDIRSGRMMCGNSKLSYRFYEALALGISTISNDIGQLLGYISPPQAMYQSWYTYDCMIMCDVSQV